jgi:hypothetical protein
MKRVLCLLVLLLVLNDIHSQCLMVPVSLETRSKLADVIVEGSLGSKTYVEREGHIFTLYEININHTYKGNIPLNALLVCEGGVLNNKMELLSYVNEYQPGTEGLFFLKVSVNHPSEYKLVAADILLI